MIQENNTAIQLIDNLQNLRYSNLDQDTFTKEYLENIYYLLNAHSLVYLRCKNDHWKILKAINTGENISSSLNNIIIESSQIALKNKFSYQQVREKIDNLKKPMVISFLLKTTEPEVVCFLYEYSSKEDLNNTILKIGKELIFIAYRHIFHIKRTIIMSS